MGEAGGFGEAVVGLGGSAREEVEGRVNSGGGPLSIPTSGLAQMSLNRLIFTSLFPPQPCKASPRTFFYLFGNPGIEAVIRNLLTAKGYSDITSQTDVKLELSCYALKKFKPDWPREKVNKASHR